MFVDWEDDWQHRLHSLELPPFIFSYLAIFHRREVTRRRNFNIALILQDIFKPVTGIVRRPRRLSALNLYPFFVKGHLREFHFAGSELLRIHVVHVVEYSFQRSILVVKSCSSILKWRKKYTESEQRNPSDTEPNYLHIIQQKCIEFTATSWLLDMSLASRKQYKEDIAFYTSWDRRNCLSWWL